MIRTIIFDFGNVVAFFDHGRAVRQLARFTDMDPVELALQLYGSPAGARKPEPAFFAHVHQSAQAEPAECLFVDDLPVNVEAAVRFGWKGIVYRADGSLLTRLQDAGVHLG